ncbi:MAG: hypothetical protein HYS86_02870 [Candidatus Chisholmbacteria bacterium]|nr:hypothetical protein [Candidatus Chisholmbacteria bacterium]
MQQRLFTLLALLVIFLSLGAYLPELYSPIRPLFPEHITRPWPSPPPSPSPSPTPEPSLEPQTQAITTSQSSATPTSITEASLYQALLAYRATHNRNPIIYEPSLCSYAYKRLSQHQERFKTLNEGDNPLDGHAGFQRDADAGSIFADTGFSSVGEVLAFLPQAQTATQVIEWGWDSSPAHREGLLSNEMTHACVVGTTPFYVGILGKR